MEKVSTIRIQAKIIFLGVGYGLQGPSFHIIVIILCSYKNRVVHGRGLEWGDF